MPSEVVVKLSNEKGCASPAAGEVTTGEADLYEHDYNDMIRLLRTMPLPHHLGGGLCKQAADAIAYLSAQDGLLSKAQDEAQRLREQLAEVERPLDQQMARLNQALIDANAANASLRAKLDEQSAQIDRQQTMLLMDKLPEVDRAITRAEVAERKLAERDAVVNAANDMRDALEDMLRPRTLGEQGSIEWGAAVLAAYEVAKQKRDAFDACLARQSAQAASQPKGKI